MSARLLAARPFERRELWKLGLLFAVALVPRLAFFVLNQASPVFDQPLMDARYHHEWALSILTGENDLWSGRVYFRAPLYPYLLAAAYAVSGKSIAFAVLLQHALGAATVVLLWLLARRRFAERVAWTAALAAAFYWPFVYFEGDLLIVSLLLFLNTLAFLLLDVAATAWRARWFLLAGVVFGLSAIARPNVLIFLPLVLPALLLRARAGRAPTRPRWLVSSLVLWLGAALPIAPVIARNWVVGHDLVPIASQGGVNLWIGNNPTADGQTAIAPGTRGDWMGGYQDTIRQAEEARGRALKPSEVSRFFLDKALDFVLHDPGRSLPLLRKKVAMFVGSGERSNNKYIYFFWDRFGLGGWPLLGFWLVGPLGFYGFLLLARRPGSFADWWLFVASYSAGVIAFFVNARFRLPVVPFLILFGAYGAWQLLGALRERGARAWPFVLLLASTSALVLQDELRFTERGPLVEAVSEFTLGNAWLRAGEDAKAIAAYEAAREADRRHPTNIWQEAAPACDFNLGRLYWKAGRREEALAALRRVRGQDPVRARALLFLADCHVQEGDDEAVLSTYRALLRDFPGQRALLERMAAAAPRTPLDEARAALIRRALGE